MATEDAAVAHENLSQFSVELGAHDLTDAEISSLGNKITQTVIDSVQSSKGDADRGKKKEPFIKIIHVKQIHSRSIRQ